MKAPHGGSLTRSIGINGNTFVPPGAWVLIALACLLGNGVWAQQDAPAELERAFVRPPPAARPWAYWWWLDSAASKEGITADLEAMKARGISGALLFDAGEGGPDAPKGPRFMSPAWRDLYRHTLREADRLGLEMGVNLCSGWDAGGTWVTPEHAAKKIVWSETFVEGAAEKPVSLPQPPATAGFYRDIAVLALPVRGEGPPGTNRLANLEMKAGRDYGIAPSAAELADLLSSAPAPEAAAPPAPRLDEVRALNGQPGPEGRLTCQVPPGRWLVIRFGYTLLGSRTKCTSPGAEGYEIDFFSRDAFDDHFAHTGGPLIEDARQAGAKSLRYFHVDSYEAGNPSWTPRFREEFQAHRGYDLLRWMPVLAGRLVESPEASHRFLWDIRRTIGDLFAANYYGRLGELSRQAGLMIHPESSGPFWHHIDALQCAGGNDVPMTEFWKRREENKEWVWWLTDCARYCDLVKQAASAAHTYGRPICQAEAYTTMGPNWEEDPFSMKDIGDRAFCAGLTRQVLCFWVHQPRLDAFPGYQWEAAGTHFDSHITWWGMSHAWLSYLARCQHLLRQGRFVADFCYFSGEDVPNYVPARSRMQPPLPAGFDCDTVNAKALLGRMQAREGRLVLPDGMSYRYLVLPQRRTLAISPKVLGKIKELAQGGVTVIGSAPQCAPGLTGWPACDAEVRSLVQELWGDGPGASGERKTGQGRVIWGRSPAEVAASDSLAPDVEFLDMTPAAIPPRFDGVTIPLDWIHRRVGEMDLYFVANVGDRTTSARVAFRTAGRQPELWDAVTGQMRDLSEFTVTNGRTAVPLQFQPKESFFVVFRRPASASGDPKPSANFAPAALVTELEGPWELAFDPKWGGPGQVTFQRLEDWTKRPEEGVRHFSGTATYRKTFDLKLPASRGPGTRFYLDLGTVKNLAAVRLNGQDLGVVWTAPWRADITAAVKPAGNALEIEVANLWPNRLIGDASLPPDKRITTTNVKKFKKETPLLPSGLLGPIRIVAAEGPKTAATP